MAFRTCGTCKEVKDLKFFYKSCTQKEGYHTQCKVCANLGTRRRKLLKDFNMTPEDYEKRYTEQNGCCAICRGFNLGGKKLAVDHDHKTGKVRGLLCGQCNLLIGIAKDSIDRLNVAATYLEGLRTY